MPCITLVLPGRRDLRIGASRGGFDYDRSYCRSDTCSVYNLAIRINRKVMYHANDRAHDLLAQSTRDALPKTESTPRAVTSEVDATTSSKQAQPNISISTSRG